MSQIKFGNVHDRDPLYPLRWSEGDTGTMSRAGQIADAVAGLSKMEVRNYSVARAIASLAGEGPEAGLERELSETIAKRISRPTTGLYIPTSIKNVTGLDTFTSGRGASTVGTEVRDLIELLRAKMMVARLGATILRGLSSNVTFPTQTAASAITWVAENPAADVSESDAAFDVVTLSPKMLSTTTSYSRKLLSQSSLDIERFVRDDLATAHALGIDSAALTGTGADNQPQGLIGTSNIGSVVMGDPNGAIPSYAKVVEFETAVSALNGDVADAAFLTTPGIRGKLKLTQRFTNSDLAIWGAGQAPGEGELAGYRAVASNQVPSTLSKGGSSNILHAMLFGYWPSLVIGEWGILEIITDVYAKKKRGMVEVCSYQMIDVACRQPSQFAVALDCKIS